MQRKSAVSAKQIRKYHRQKGFQDKFWEKEGTIYRAGLF